MVQLTLYGTEFVRKDPQLNFEIVTDSSCNLPDSIVGKYDIHILPLSFMSEGKEYASYTDGKQGDLKQFYTMMRAGKVFTTSLPSSDNAEKVFRSLLEKGRDVLYIGFSSGISGTYDAMSGVLDRVAVDYPERKALHIDTRAASLGEGLLVYHACVQADEGASIEEVHAWLDENRFHMAHWFTVDDLMFLFRGGRVSRTSAWAGSLLNIKPVLHMDDAGLLIPMEKVRGRKKSIVALLNHMRKSAIQPVAEQTVYISHGDCIDEAEQLADMIREELGVTDIMINYIDPVIGAHAGPGTLALFFLATER